ncbi:AbrB/MazE/SpoVT family DNA-binding domain-containing protein [Sphingobium yanoikuyae]|uniref:AbrB/MazE/SpoVT family DNA-binding domain-containing protein n=1 Tax=Sphingobium yanoikuyae TaxID=13690 RepID=A0A3G2ULU2_SPHYA|nr:AbrB/MazE/SpoVT family DNA-binding domain-containing protein [Sphingobium yanoikuyae]AYO75923.1 AbrB/MazE/SpoVT family DNA-binding domain-containing protein [Sphingobium yanoikuyae]
MTRQVDHLIDIDRNGEFQLPKEIMARHGWGPGTRLLLEEMPDGLRLKAVPAGYDGTAR